MTNNNIQLNIDFYKKIKTYTLGFIFSIILTIIPFILVIKKIFLPEQTYLLIVICAISQILIHFLYFLDLDFSIEKRWYLISLLFITIIIFILLCGSMWIMSNLNHFMKVD